ncbi:MAG: 4Fe-4S domain-containing protein [bacterium]
MFEFYVDESCITCGSCMEKAPYNFKFTVGDKHAIVNKQPCISPPFNEGFFYIDIVLYLV